MTGHITLMHNALFARFCFFVNMAVSRSKMTGIHAVCFERRTKHTHACVQGTITVTSLHTASFVKRVLKAHVAVSREAFIVAYLTRSFSV